jgi:DNA-binding HxlR family transcriptional regulator
MQADGLVLKKRLVPATKGVRYALTPHGHTLAPVFERLWEWGTRHLARPGASRGTVVAPPRRVPGTVAG